MTFCFPVADIDLSPKRIECMSKSIREAEGTVIEFNGSQIEGPIDFLLINPKTPIGLVLRKVYGKITFREMLDYNFILRSLREETLLAINDFSCYKARQEQEEDDDEEKTVTLAKKPQKVIRGNYHQPIRTVTVPVV